MILNHIHSGVAAYRSTKMQNIVSQAERYGNIFLLKDGILDCNLEAFVLTYEVLS